MSPPYDGAPGGTPARQCRTSCQKCGRLYFPLLLVRPTPVDARDARRLRASAYGLSPVLGEAYRSLSTEGSAPYARVLGEGFVFVFYSARGRWDVWRSHADGTYRKLLEQASAEDYARMSGGLDTAAGESVCARGAANLKAGLITLVGPETQPVVWLAYSPHLWAPQVLRDYAADAHGERAQRMTELKTKAWLDGGDKPAHADRLFESVLEASVIEFAPAKDASLMQKAFARAVVPLGRARFGQAGEMAKAARELERTAGEKARDKALIVLLRDPIGMAEEYNQLRLRALDEKKAWVAGGPDETGQDDDALRAWKLRSGLHAEMIEQWAVATARLGIREDVSRRMQHPVPMNEDVYRAQLANGRLPAGTTWEPIPKVDPDYRRLLRMELPRPKPKVGHDGEPEWQWVDSTIHPGRQTRIGRLRAPAADIQRVAERRGAASSEGRKERYRRSLRFDELSAFRTEFEAASRRWDDFIAQRDADWHAWLRHGELACALRHDFDTRIDLTRPDTARGTPAQQVADVVARLEAVEKAWGGGAIGPVSAKALAALMGQSPDDPEQWIDQALLAPFSYTSAVLQDADKRKSAMEALNGLVELPQQVQSAVNAQRARMEQAANGLLAVRLQGVQLAAAALDPERAAQLNLPVPEARQAMHALRIHVRTAALLDAVLNPGTAYFTVQFKAPPGEVLDRAVDAFNRGMLDARLDAKDGTRRQERRQVRKRLNRLTGRPGLDVPEFFPVAVERHTLERLSRQAARAGEDVVEVLSDPTLGSPLSGPIHLPKSVALALIDEQVNAGRAYAQALRAGETKFAGVVAVFQLYALYDALSKIDKAKGYDRIDAFTAISSSLCGLLEAGLTVSALGVELRSQGTRLVLATRFMRSGLLRFAAGTAGAAAAGFDAWAAWGKYRSRKEQGDYDSSDAYGFSSRLYIGSGTTLLLGASVFFAQHVAVRASTSATGALAQAILVRIPAGLTPGLLGGSLTGIGIVLTVLGFGYALYAQEMEDDLNEVFLKRSYWGTHDVDDQRSEGRFGGDVMAHADATQRLDWAKRGLEGETGAFAALSVGIKASLQWHDNWFGADAVEAKVETAVQDGEQFVQFTLRLLTTGGSVTLAEGQRAPLLLDEQSGRQILAIEWPLTSEQVETAQGARFDYTVYTDTPRAPLARDSLQVKKDD